MLWQQFAFRKTHFAVAAYRAIELNRFGFRRRLQISFHFSPLAGSTCFVLSHRQQSIALWLNDKSSLNCRKFEKDRNKSRRMVMMWCGFESEFIFVGIDWNFYLIIGFSRRWRWTSDHRYSEWDTSDAVVAATSDGSDILHWWRAVISAPLQYSFRLSDACEHSFFFSSRLCHAPHAGLIHIFAHAMSIADVPDETKI